MTLLLPLLLACGQLLGCGDRNPGEELVGLRAVKAGETGCPDWYYDADGDGHGDVDLAITVCDEPVGYSAYGDDCDDISPLAFPGGTETCGNGLDEDCDGADLPCELPASGELSSLATRFTSTTADNDAHQPLALGDVDGDGQADLVLGLPELDSYSGRARIIHGPLDGTRSDWDAEVTLADTSTFGGLASAALAGFDMDGDGFADLMLGASNLTISDRGTVYLLSGPLGATTQADMDGQTFYTSLGNEGLGATMAGGADLTGDGVADLVLGSCCDGASPAWVMPGPLTYTSVSANGYPITPTTSSRQSFTAMALGDATGDGIADLAVGESNPDSGVQDGRAYLIEGPIDAAMDLADAGTRIDSSAIRDGFGRAVLLADLDLDGLDDLVVGAPLRELAGVTLGMVVVLTDPAGRGTAEDTAATTTLYGSGSDAYMGFSLAAVQLDGVGAPELLVGAPGLNAFEGGVYVFLDAGAGGTRTSADRSWLGTSAGDLIGFWATAGADLDGDGAPDAIVAGISDGSEGDAWLVPGG